MEKEEGFNYPRRLLKTFSILVLFLLSSTEEGITRILNTPCSNDIDFQ